MWIVSEYNVSNKICPSTDVLASMMWKVECQPFGTLEINVKDYRVEEGGFLKITVKNIPGDGGLQKLELRGKPNSYAVS